MVRVPVARVTALQVASALTDAIEEVLGVATPIEVVVAVLGAGHHQLGADLGHLGLAFTDCGDQIDRGGPDDPVVGRLGDQELTIVHHRGPEVAIAGLEDDGSRRARIHPGRTVGPPVRA